MYDLELLRLNVCQTYLGLAKHVATPSIKISNALWTCASPFQHPIGNFACHLNLTPPDMAQVAAMALKSPHFRVYCVGGDFPVDVEQQLAAMGLAERYRLVGLIHSSPTPARVGEMRVARTQAEVASVAKFMVETFFWRSPKSLREPLARVLAASTLEGQDFYWLPRGKQVAAAVTLSRSEGVGGIYNLCVRLEERDRGLGAAAVQQLLGIIGAEGLVPFLQCEATLAPWYQRLGFEAATYLSAMSS